MSTDMEHLEGGTLSLEHRYRVERYRDQHGLVARYSGLQLPFERPVWLEVYRPLADAGADPRVFERLKRSAHRAHRIDHPNVLRLLDYGELDRGVPFVVTERIDGPSLATHLDEHGPLSPDQATDLAVEIADALQAAHDHDLTHGTLDPCWISLVDGEPARPRVGHFTVGPTLDELRRIDGAVLTPELVRPYPPETFDRDTIPPDELGDDHRPTDAFTIEADVYALGCIVYEALVGFHPYFDQESTDASEGIVQLQSEDPRPLEELGVPPELASLVHRAIARNPEDRWGSAGTFAERLREFRADGDSTEEARSAPEPAEGLSPPEEADQPSDEETGESTATPPEQKESLEPGGPASLLVTMAIGLLIASNVAWFFYYMNQRAGDDEAAEGSRPAPAVRDIEIDANPSDAAVFYSGREEPKRTPFTIPTEALEAGPLKLKLKKPGYETSTVHVEQSASTRSVRVDLCETNSN